MRGAIVAAVLGLLQCLPFAAASQTVVAGAVASAAVHTDAPLRGALYRVRHGSHTIHLFGTIHVGEASFYPLEPKVNAALASAAKLAVELDARDGSAFQTALRKHGVYANGATLRSRLSPDNLVRLERALARFGIPIEQVAHLKPWLVANLLHGLAVQRLGFERRHGLEAHLLAHAAVKSMPVIELENAEYQMSLFDGMAEDVQESYLREQLAELEDGRAMQKAHMLIDGWRHADQTKLNTYMRNSLQENTVASNFIHRILLDKRNPEMANRIEALLRSEPAVFVAVGLLHLMGETGVPALLVQRGYSVEKIY
jgi:uncharacterized protein YbaP (TraB family)